MIGVECIGCAKPLQLKRRYVYTGPGGVSSLATDPPGPRWPPAESKCEKRSAKSKKNETSKTARRFTSLQMFHTHAPLPRGFFQWITTPLLEAKKRKKFFISSDVRHTRPDAARLFSRCLFIYIYIYIHIYIYVYTQDLFSLPKGKGWPKPGMNMSKYIHIYIYTRPGPNKPT